MEISRSVPPEMEIKNGEGHPLRYRSCVRAPQPRNRTDRFTRFNGRKLKQRVIGLTACLLKFQMMEHYLKTFFNIRNMDFSAIWIGQMCYGLYGYSELVIINLLTKCKITMNFEAIFNFSHSPASDVLKFSVFLNS